MAVPGYVKNNKMEVEKKTQLGTDHLISGRQIRMARAALGWRVDDLAKKSGVQWARIQKIERNNDVSFGVDEKLKLIKKTLEENGIEFCVSNKSHLGYVILLENIKNK